jgi:hypothetical protein
MVIYPRCGSWLSRNPALRKYRQQDKARDAGNRVANIVWKFDLDISANASSIDAVRLAGSDSYAIFAIATRQVRLVSQQFRCATAFNGILHGILVMLGATARGRAPGKFLCGAHPATRDQIGIRMMSW